MKGVIPKNNPAAIKALGKKIAVARKSKRFSKLQLSKTIGLAHVQLGQYEQGKSAPTMENLEKIARVLEISVEYFLDTTSKPRYSFDYRKWVQKGEEVLSETDQIKVAEYIQLLCMKTESEKMATTYLK